MNFSAFVIISDKVNEHMQVNMLPPAYAFIDNDLYKDLKKEFEQQRRVGGIDSSLTSANANALISIYTIHGNVKIKPVNERNFLMLANNEKDYLNYHGDMILLGGAIDESSYMWR